MFQMANWDNNVGHFALTQSARPICVSTESSQLQHCKIFSISGAYFPTHRFYFSKIYKEPIHSIWVDDGVRSSSSQDSSVFENLIL